MKKVLYVDDEDINLFIFRNTFKNDFQILTALSATEALKILEANNDINTIISDLKMPVMNGIELARKTKETYPNIPFYLLTAYHMNPEIESAMEEGIILKYFLKPMDRDEIRNVLSNS